MRFGGGWWWVPHSIRFQSTWLVSLRMLEHNWGDIGAPGGSPASLAGRLQLFGGLYSPYNKCAKNKTFRFPNKNVIIHCIWNHFRIIRDPLRSPFGSSEGRYGSSLRTGYHHYSIAWRCEYFWRIRIHFRCNPFHSNRTLFKKRHVFDQHHWPCPNWGDWGASDFIGVDSKYAWNPETFLESAA